MSVLHMQLSGGPFSVQFLRDTRAIAKALQTAGQPPVDPRANKCPRDGAPTELIDVLDCHTVERCPACGRVYTFWEK